MRVAFACFVLDTDTRELRRGGARVHLEPKALELLGLLVARRPQAVAKAEIQERLWPGTFVSESSLTGLVAQVRRALGDDRRQERFLRTVHGFGYAFRGDAVAEDGPAGEPVARLVWGEQVLGLRAGENVLGRGEEASVRIDAPGVSRRHARVMVTAEGATLEDLASKNGTFVGDGKVEAAVRLRDGDLVRLGGQLLVFRLSGRSAETWTEGAARDRER